MSTLLKTFLAAAAVAAGATLTPGTAHAGSTVRAFDVKASDGLPLETMEARPEFEIGLGDKLLTNHGDSHTEGTPVDIWQRTTRGGAVAQPNQRWRFEPLLIQASSWPPVSDHWPYRDFLFESGGRGMLRNVESGLCLASTNSADLTALEQRACTPWHLGMLWRAARDQAGGWSIRQEASGRYLGVNAPWSQLSDGLVARLRGDEAVGKPLGSWSIKRIDARGGYPVALTPVSPSAAGGRMGISLASDNPAGEWGVDTRLRTSADTAEQTWFLHFSGEEHGTRMYKIVSAPQGDWSKAVCLTARGATPGLGTVVDTYGCDPNGPNSENQLWYARVKAFTHQTSGTLHGHEFFNLAGTRNEGAGLFDSRALRLSANTLRPSDGSRLYLDAADATGALARQVWGVDLRTTPDSGAGSTSTSTCSGYACMLNLG